MGLTPFLPGIPCSKPLHEEEEDERLYQSYRDLVSTLPADNSWLPPLSKYLGFWSIITWLPGTLAARDHFVARPGDIFLAAVPKSGTTWLKSLVFSLLHRGPHPPSDPGHPLLSANPHDLVHLLDELYIWHKNPDLTHLPSPRVFATHCPYSILPQSVKSSGCRVVFVAREPKDNFVSGFHFLQAIQGVENRGRVGDYMDLFCSGVSPGGPIWEHILEYWNEHLRRPNDVLFLKYEAMKEDTVGTKKNIAGFLGCPFSPEEEREGLPENISKLCSFGNLSNLEVNRDGHLHGRAESVKKKIFFRRGEVGDWANHLTPAMAAKVDEITREKFAGSGLSF